MTSTYNSDLSPADYLFPSHLQIEIIAGICSADCIMCTINSVSRKGILNISSYTTILDKFSTHLNKIKHLSLFGMGEPLLDPTLAEKIAIAKQKGFSNIGFATNLTHLTAEKADSLLTAGLDTIIFSIDGINKITHEKIRRGTNYDEILNNALRFIDARNTKQNKTKQK